MNDSITPTKKCTKCGSEKPATSEFWYKSSIGKYGFQSVCKICKQSKAKYPKAPEGHKLCRKCGEFLPAIDEYFYRDEKGRLNSPCKKCISTLGKEYRERNAEKRSEYERRRYEANKEEYAERNRQYREEHKEELRESNRRYYEENKEAHNTRTHQYYYENRERISAQNNQYRATRKEWYSEYNRQYRKENRERIRENQRKWEKEHPENRKASSKRAYVVAKLSGKKRVDWLNRRARKRSLPNTFTAQEWQACLEYFHYTCAICGNQLRDLFGNIEPHADHWIPIANPDCLGTVAKNMVCLCNHCNKSKAAKLPHVWLEEKFDKHKAKEILTRVQAYFDSL